MFDGTYRAVVSINNPNEAKWIYCSNNYDL